MVSLITYANRLGSNLSELRRLLEGPLAGLFTGVHILPFFDPIDGEDAGFDPIDHLAVDSRIGDWESIGAIAENHSVMADLIANHVSAQSAAFLDVRTQGDTSAHWPLFLRKDSVFKDLSKDALANQCARIYRPRPGAPFTTITLDNGQSYEFWTTFSANQLDINVEHPAGKSYLEAILHQFADAGVKEVRLDAAGYAIKRAGTSCFMLPETFEFIAELSDTASSLGIETLVEIHSHYEVQCEIAKRVGRVYDFALPPLVLHTLYQNDSSPLKHWLSIAPRNCVTVLDTHDGIGIVDAGPSEDRPGLLNEAQIDALVETIHDKTQGQSREASGESASNLDIYQVNSTYYDALGGNDTDYLIARAIQFFAPGTPQVYYVGLLAGVNDLALVKETDTGRDINRHYYNETEIEQALNRPVVQELMALIRLRNELPVFNGEFTVDDSDDKTLSLSWLQGDNSARLVVDLINRSAIITGTVAGKPMTHTVGAMVPPALAETA